MITVEPPVVQPSLGEIALMQGTADAGYKPVIWIQRYVSCSSLRLFEFIRLHFLSMWFFYDHPQKIFDNWQPNKIFIFGNMYMYYEKEVNPK